MSVNNLLWHGDAIGKWLNEWIFHDLMIQEARHVWAHAFKSQLIISAKYQLQQQHNDYCPIFTSCAFLMVLSDYNVTILTNEIVSAIAYDLNEKIFHCKTAAAHGMIWSFLYCISFSFPFGCIKNIATDRWVEILFKTYIDLCGTQVKSVCI